MTVPDSPQSVASPAEPVKVTGRLMMLWKDGKQERWFRLPNDWKQGDDIPDYRESGAEMWLTDEGQSFSKGASPGQVFEFDFSPDGKIVYFQKKGRRKIVGFANAELAMRLKAIHDDFAGRDALLKESAGNEVLKFLDPVKEAYAKSFGSARAQMLARIVRYITS